MVVPCIVTVLFHCVAVVAGVPLVFESLSWEHGVMVGAAVKSESTAAAEFKGNRQNLSINEQNRSLINTHLQLRS